MSSKGFRILGIGLVVLLAGAGLFLGLNSAPQTVEAQDQATTTVQLPRTITVVGEGTVAVEPDVAEVQIGVDMTGDTADEARAEVATTMDAIMAALTSLKIPKKDIQTSGFNIFVERPTTPDGLPSEKVIYHVSNNVTVTIRDLAKAGDVLEAAIDAGANNIYGVNFSVGNPDPVMVEARRKASEDALARAEELAALHGVEVGEVVSISEVIDGNAAPLESINARLAAGGGVGQIAPGELEMTARLQVVYAIAGSASAAQ